MITNPFFTAMTFILITVISVSIISYSFTGNKTIHPFLKWQVPVFLFAWGAFQAVLATSGFYLSTDTIPPRILFGILPMLLLIAWMVKGPLQAQVRLLSLKTLTLIHLIRVPVELVLWQLHREGLIPQLMTFEGRNLDILSGITAPLIYMFAFRKKGLNRKALLLWNFAALGLLANIVIHAMLAMPSPIQLLAFDQPNRAILVAPYIWLPTIVVPIVLFAHVVSMIRLYEDGSLPLKPELSKQS